MVAGDGLFGLLDLRFERVDALQQLLLIGLRRRLVGTQAVEPGFQRDVRLLLGAQRSEQRRNQTLAPLHEALEVRSLAETPFRLLVTLLCLLGPLLELRHRLATLVRERADVLGMLLLFLELRLEAGHLLARIVALAHEGRLLRAQRLELPILARRNGSRGVESLEKVRELGFEPLLVVAEQLDLAIRAEQCVTQALELAAGRLEHRARLSELGFERRNGAIARRHVVVAGGELSTVLFSLGRLFIQAAVSLGELLADRPHFGVALREPCPLCVDLGIALRDESGLRRYRIAALRGEGGLGGQCRIAFREEGGLRGYFPITSRDLIRQRRQPIVVILGSCGELSVEIGDVVALRREALVAFG